MIKLDEQVQEILNEASEPTIAAELLLEIGKQSSLVDDINDRIEDGKNTTDVETSTVYGEHCYRLEAFPVCIYCCSYDSFKHIVLSAVTEFIDASLPDGIDDFFERDAFEKAILDDMSYFDQMNDKLSEEISNIEFLTVNGKDYVMFEKF